MGASTRFGLLLMAAIVPVASAAADGLQGDFARTYFPLSVGNSWTYTNGAQEKTFTIVGTEQMNGHTYYLFDDFYHPWPLPQEDVPPEEGLLLRYDSDADSVLQYFRPLGEDIARYDFSGDRWGGSFSVLEEMGSYTVPAGQFDDCCTFMHFSPWCWCTCGRETLAPGVGTIAFTEHAEPDRPVYELQYYTVVSEHALPGDLDNDGFVGQGDLDVILAQWGQSGAEIIDPQADANADGFVGQADLDYVLADWGQGPGAPGPPAVPEPITLGIFAFCGFALLRRKPKFQ